MKPDGKNILIFSDGTGQIGGLRPDQRLTNIYKMYRAMRPGPDSPIAPSQQVAIYDAGLGTEADGWFKRIKNTAAAALGSGIDENIIDCYAAIIAHYEPGDRIFLFGFSRGAYTVRALANVMYLCGVPQHDGDDKPVPKKGPRLRKIATDAVKYVYNHTAGTARNDKSAARYQHERAIKAERFRDKYGAHAVPGPDGEPIKPKPVFVGVFDTVAALNNRLAVALAFAVLAALLAGAVSAWLYCSIWIAIGMTAIAAAVGLAVIRLWSSFWKYFIADPYRHVSFGNPLDWPVIWRSGHLAIWTGTNFDTFVDRDIRFLRHAQSIDEDRKSFARVGWAHSNDVDWHNDHGRPDWLRQIWFAGNHSDIGGSYPELESRLSDITLEWMLGELEAAMPGVVQKRDDLLYTWPDHRGLQHDERLAILLRQPGWMRRLTHDRLTWPRASRAIDDNAPLDESVRARAEAPAVPYLNAMRAYRPLVLRGHRVFKRFFSQDNIQSSRDTRATR